MQAHNKWKSEEITSNDKQLPLQNKKETQDPKFPHNYLKLNYLIYLFENEKR